MRVSCDPKDQGFSPHFNQFIPTLNGLAMPHAVTADEELGIVRVMGRLSNGDEVEQVLFGMVKIERLH
jgi:hypothetical protein